LKSRNITVLILFVLSLFILWKLCPSQVAPEDGLLSSHTPEPTPPVQTPDTTPEATPELVRPLYTYEEKRLETSSGPLVLHVLSIDMTNPHITVKPVTSHRTLFGYEYLSVMAETYHAVAAVNGGFSHSNGLPGGMIYANKELKTPASGKFPVLFLMEDRAVLSDATQELWLESEGRRLSPIVYNGYSQWGGLFVFTPVYGSTDRLDKPHLTARVVNGRVVSLENVDTMAKIPGDGFLVSAVGSDVKERLKAFVEPGMPLEIKSTLKAGNPDVEEYLSAYECGSWIVRDGADVSPREDAWAGNLTGRAPRTAVGIGEDGTLVFVVADGRQESSVGASASELAQILIDMGIRDAALLDGGASSEMIIEGEIVNQPSAGRERMLFSCFLLLKK